MTISGLRDRAGCRQGAVQRSCPDALSARSILPAERETFPGRQQRETAVAFPRRRRCRCRAAASLAHRPEHAASGLDQPGGDRSRGTYASPPSSLFKALTVECRPRDMASRRHISQLEARAHDGCDYTNVLSHVSTRGKLTVLLVKSLAQSATGSRCFNSYSSSIVKYPRCLS